jgi:hypothetical protein
LEGGPACGAEGSRGGLLGAAGGAPDLKGCAADVAEAGALGDFRAA